MLDLSLIVEKSIEEARQGISKKHGGPFGSVIFDSITGDILASGHNRVLIDHDPTCHGEVVAIRNACSKLKTHDLKGYSLYTTCAPCPMCLSAMIWANIDNCYYGCTSEDAERIGFRDAEMFDHFKGKINMIVCSEYKRNECLELFAEYKKMDKELY